MPNASDTIVCKFCGNSLADVERIEKVFELVKGNSKRRFVVVSAPGKETEEDSKITDLLYLCKSNFDANAPFDEVYAIIEKRFLAIEEGLGIDAGIAEELKKIKANIFADAEEDYVASRGGYLNAKIVAKYFGFDFIDAADHIVFDLEGNLAYEKTNKRLEKELEKHERAIIPGFYGRLPDKKIKTFPRGGSDISGALIARAAKAAVYENWTDDSGFLMADPAIVKEPKKISELTFDELRELSYIGASVIHENAVYLARLAGLPINVRNVNDPKNTGTMILKEPTKGKGNRDVITGIAGKRDFTVFTIYKSAMMRKIGFLRRILSVFEERHIPVDHMPTGIGTVSIVVSGEALAGQNLAEIRADLGKRTEPDALEMTCDMSLIATVGQGMASKRGVAARLFKSLSEAKINVRMIDQGASETNIIIGVRDGDYRRAVRAIYNEFVV